MIILGLGSNIGDRLSHLRLTLAALKQLPLRIQQVSPLYQSEALLPDNAPDDWNQPYLNCALRCETSLSADALLPLIKAIEHRIGRKPVKRHWGPRVIDIDILAHDQHIIHSDLLTVPHRNLLNRPFALWPLADVAPRWIYPLTGESQGKTAAELVEPWGSRFDGNAPFHTQQIPHRIDTPELFGILNITPDSFSDGGQYAEPEKALTQAIALNHQGADIIDIGAESTAPNAKLLTAEEEWARLSPVLSLIFSEKNKWLIPPRFSVDTRHAVNAERALQLGAHIINDQSGLNNQDMIALIAATKSPCVIMHHLSLPASAAHRLPPQADPITAIKHWAELKINALLKENIALENIIIDPGIGFGKTPEQSLEIIQSAHAFKSLGPKILIGHSRKSFMSVLTPATAQQRDLETAIFSLALAHQSIHYLRVHNIDFTARALKIASLSQPLQTTQI